MKIGYTNSKFPTGIFVFKNQVMTLVWEEVPHAFIINSKQNYLCYKQFFEEMWKIAKE